ncbi:MAG: stage V sporulation protein AD [Bacilli bacterium]
MTIKFDNVYLNEVSTSAGLDEKEGLLGKLYDKTYDNYYNSCKTFEQAEIKIIKDNIKILLSKSKKKIEDISVILGADLLNQITASSYASASLNRPFLGVYSACASLCEELMIASSLLQNNNINSCLCMVSSHNATAERQFRNPTEYGCPKPKRATFTVTGSASAILSKEKGKIKITSATIGTTTDMGITDVYDMGTVMAPSAARTINDHLKDTNQTISDYDLILTGDLGIYGKETLKKFMKEVYNTKLDYNYEDSACIIYDIKKQKKVNAGGSGPACLALVTYTDVLNKMKKGQLKKVLLVATGALMSPTMNNQKLSIPSISHAVSLEVEL